MNDTKLDKKIEEDIKMEETIATTQECAKVCLETLSHCLKMGGEHAEQKHIMLLYDCAYLCEASTNFMARGSEYHSTVCGLCAEVCETCAESCKSLDGEEMEQCAEACTKCAESCREMV